jgi:hypothetical protein
MSRTLTLVALVTVAGCQTITPTGNSEAALIATTKFASLANVGTLAYGATSPAIAYTSSPVYREFTFAGGAGDAVDVRVSSANGDSIAWLVDGSGHIVAQNDDADDTTVDSHLTASLAGDGNYQIIFRELDLSPAGFQVTLACTAGRCGAPGCTPGTSQCADGRTVEVCSATGVWVKHLCAGFGAYCSDGACQPGCTRCGNYCC